MDMAPQRYVCAGYMGFVLSGVISAFIDNVATVLMVAPVGLAVCRKLKINPIGMILSIGSPRTCRARRGRHTMSIMSRRSCAHGFHQIFLDERPGIFFAVELGAPATVPTAVLLPREKELVSARRRPAVEDYAPTVLLVALVLTPILASFAPAAGHH